MTESISIMTTSAHDCHQPKVEKMPGHWLLARMGKRVVRPGGVELTRRMLEQLAISSTDDVVEFAPGLGITAHMAWAQNPKSYIAVERNPEAAAVVMQQLCKANQKCVWGTAEETGLPDRSATVVYGEAMLSMQPSSTNQPRDKEAGSLLKTSG